ncbi:MAG: hypothetical protein LBB73_07840 [Dysgonamonadaceae bacterium]|jgi:hypothetical protein|nr:hypothetical protein [Dysgonamonadaceae bacterium]
MKNLSKLAALLLLAGFIFSCTNDDIVKRESKNQLSVAKRFAIAKEASVFHSDGLDFAFSKIQEENEQNILKAARISSDTNQVKTLVSDILAEYFSKDSIILSLSSINSIFPLSSELISESSVLKSDSEHLHSSKVLDFFKKTVKDMAGLRANERESLIEAAIETSEFTNLLEEEQNLLLLTFAIYLDSSHYWESNLEAWYLYGNNIISPSLLRCSWWDPTTWDWDAICNTVQDYALTDAIGAIAWGGAGAAAGCFAAGVGAVGGATTGAVGGAVGCSLEKALKELCK